ncbi:hypothetical protein pb186bvf_017865 [Paramecium bursaria]
MQNYQSINHIFDNIYLGDCIAASNQRLMQRFNIELIVTVAENINISTKIKNLKYQIKDTKSEDIVKYITIVGEQIEQYKDVNIYIHCRHGVSRSASIVIGYLIKFKKLTYEDAFNLVKSKRYCISPNLNFQQQLKSL